MKCPVCGKEMNEINKILQIFLNDRISWECSSCGIRKDEWLPETAT